MPGVPLPAIDDFIIKKRAEKRRVQEMFTARASLIASITNVDNNGSGVIRITAPAHGLSTSDKVIIAGVGGTTEANGYWTVTNVSSSQFTLNSSTYTNAWTSGGGVYNGVGYNVKCDSAPSSPGVLVVNNYKQITTSGSVTATPVFAKQITTTTEAEIMLASPDYAQAVSSLVITNNSGSTIAGSVKIKTTKLLGVDAQIVVPWSLPDDYSLVIGGDGIRSLYKGDGLPYTS